MASELIHMFSFDSNRWCNNVLRSCLTPQIKADIIRESVVKARLHNCKLYARADHLR